MRRLRMLDLFAGLGGASAAMRQRGWEVMRVDVDPAFGCEVTVDLSTWTPPPGPWDLVWASPPCEEFARESMPWCKTGVPASMALVRAALRIIGEAAPTWWALENVRGSLRQISAEIGPPLHQFGPSQSYVWGRLPLVLWPRVMAGKERRSSTAHAERARIPFEISLALARAIEGVTEIAA